MNARVRRRARSGLLMATVALAAVALLLVPIVASDAPVTAAEPLPPIPSGPLPAIDMESQIVFPLDPYFLAPEDDVTLQRAAGVLTERCMSGLGLQYDPPEPFPARALRGRARLFGPIDLREVAAFGYHGYPSSGGAPNDEEKQGRLVSPEVERALTGVEPETGTPVPDGSNIPHGGCFEEASRGLNAGEPVDDDLLLGMEAVAGSQALEDPRLVAAFSTWSTCMASQGMQYADPYAANDDPAWATEVTDRERQVASADVRCKEETNLIATWVAITQAYQSQLLDSNRDDLALFSRQNEDRLTRAAGILASTS